LKSKSYRNNFTEADVSMSSMHLDDLRRTIESRKWIILSEMDGDDFSISAIWIVANRAGKKIRLIFEGMGDLSVLPIEESYACHLEEDKVKSLYFGKNNKAEWKANLQMFADQLSALLK
jgi:hypothetical protein